MANPGGRFTAQDGMEIVIDDINDLQKLKEQELYDLVLFHMIQQKEDSFFESSMRCDFVDGDTVKVLKGLGFQTDTGASGAEPEKKLLALENDTNVDTTAPDGSDDRIDVVSVKWKRVVTESDTRKVKEAPPSEVINSISQDIKDGWDIDITVTAGTPAGSPVAPSIPAGEIKIAELYVTAVSGIANQAAITDSRSLIPLGEDILIDTAALGTDRLTQGLGVAIKTLIGEIDGFLKNGDFEDSLFEELTGDPANPAADHIKVFGRDNTSRVYLKDSSGNKVPMFFEEIYDHIVSDGPMGTHTTLAAALAAASNGDRIFVNKSETIASGSVPTLANTDLEIVFKRGITYTKGTATEGLIIGSGASGARIVGGRFLNFSTASDNGIEIDNAANYVQIRDTRFNNCDTNVDTGTSGTESISGTITE